jgi:hypothetical protein
MRADSCFGFPEARDVNFCDDFQSMDAFRYVSILGYLSSDQQDTAIGIRS